MRQSAILYDADCGFCKWTLAKLLAWDRRRRLQPVSLQDPQANALLRGMEDERKMRSWHLVGADGTIYSAGEAAAPLVRLLPGGRPLAAVLSSLPRTTERLYAWVAASRGRLGPLVSRAAVARAEKRIDERASAAAPRHVW